MSSLSRSYRCLKSGTSTRAIRFAIEAIGKTRIFPGSPVKSDIHTVLAGHDGPF